MQEQPITPQPNTPLAPTTINEEQRKNKLKLIWGLICLIGPSALFLVAILLYAVTSFVTSSVTPADSSDLLSNTSNNTVINIILFLFGAISVATWLPGIIVGIVLLATRKKLS